MITSPVVAPDSEKGIERMSRSIVPRLVSLSVLFLAASATSSGNEDGKPLPGSTVTVRDAARQARLIALANVVGMGIADPDTVGSLSYDHAKVHVVRCLKGRAEGDLTVSITVKFYPETMRNRYTEKVSETVPASGQKYLFYVGQGDVGELRVIKILPASVADTVIAQPSPRPMQPLESLHYTYR